VHASSGTTGKSYRGRLQTRDDNPPLVGSHSRARSPPVAVHRRRPAAERLRLRAVHGRHGSALRRRAARLHGAAHLRRCQPSGRSSSCATSRPRCWLCTPSYALFLAEAARDRGLQPDDLPVRVGFHGRRGRGTNEMRRQIEQGLGIDAIDMYGLSEMGGPRRRLRVPVQGRACTSTKTTYLAEIVDRETLKPVPEGTVGGARFQRLSVGGRSRSSATARADLWQPHLRNPASVGAPSRA